MPVCFICKAIVDLHFLRSHFFTHKGSHPLNRFECKETDVCKRYFNLYSSFRKHIIRKHMSQNITPQFPKCFNVLSSPSVSCDNLNLSPESSSSQLSQTISHQDPSFAEETSMLSNTPCDFKKKLATFFASLYGNPNLPRSITQLVMNGFHNVINDCLLPSLNNTFVQHIKEGLISNEIKNQLMYSITPMLTSPLKEFRTEHSRIKYFSDLGTYIAPEPHRLGERLDRVKSGGITRVKAVPCVAYVIPLRKVFKLFFSLKNILRETLQHMQTLQLQSDCTTNFIQGDYWRTRLNHAKSRIVIPCFIFFDDYESGNVLGSRSGLHKLGAVYVTIPCLPPWRTSTLTNIFLALLFHSSDRSEFGNAITFKPLVDEFNFLNKEGIEFDVEGFKETIYFELALILGDNLGIHSITGFVESFSGNFPCRVCKVKKEVMWTQFREDDSLLRTMDDYYIDLLENNVSTTGIKERCLWLDVSDFNLFDQVGCDFMHDILEGVGKYILSFVLNDIIFKQKYVSLEDFNNRITLLSYGPDAKNKPCCLTREHLLGKNIRLSASEILTLTRYLTFLVGSNVPVGDKTWKLYLAYRQVVDFLLSPIIINGSECYLKVLVEELNELYLDTGSEKLKPKFHNLLHYHRVLVKFGPVVHFWSMRFEAKHRLSKMAARVNFNRINLTFSLATKHQLALNEIFLKGELNNVLETSSQQFDLTIFEKSFLSLDLSLDKSKSLIRISWANMSSVRYQKGTILVFDPVPDGERDDVVFISVDKLYIYDKTKLILTGTKFVTICFNQHLCAYEVSRTTINDNVAMFFDFLPQQIPHTLHAHSNNKLYITLRSPL